MDLERWAELSAATDGVDRRRGPTAWTDGVDRHFEPNGRDAHPTSRVVRVHRWSVLHDRPTSWACRPGNWPAADRLRAIGRPEPPAGIARFGPCPYASRTDVERSFGGLGLLRRRAWGKLLVNAARVRLLEQRRAARRTILR